MPTAVSSEFRGPTFLVLGAHRAAMRWLQINLADHPDVYVADRPVRYFTDPRPGGIRGYRASFRRGADAAAIGEVDPELLRSTRDLLHLRKSIDSRLPDVRLVAVVREPVDRMWSAFRDHVIHGRLPMDSDLLEMIRRDDPAIEALDLIGAGRYAQNLYPFWRTYGERLLIVVHDDIRTDPAKVYEQVLTHIGVTADFTPRRLEQVLYSNAHSRWVAATMPDDQRRNLAMLFRNDVQELEAMLGRVLTAWDPGPPSPGWESHLSERELAAIGVG